MRSQRIGSPYWTVVFGNCRRFQLRIREEPWIAIGTTGAPVSSARRPIPRLASVGDFAGARAPALAVHRDRPAAREDRLGGDEHLLVARAAPHREDAAVGVDELHRSRFEELRLGHEADLAPDVAAHQEVVHEREVVGREDHRAGAGHLLGGDRARAQERVGVQRGEHPRQLIRPVRFARARALVKAVEVLLRPRVVVDLLAHRCEIAHLSVLPRCPRESYARASSASSQPASSAARSSSPIRGS